MKIFYFFLSLFFLISCSTSKPTITQTQKIQIKDSVIIRDSIVLIPIERVKEIENQYDTLYLETSIAKAAAWIDTTRNTLTGVIENKSNTNKQVTYIEKYVEKTDTIKIIKPEPYPEPTPYTPTIFKWSMGFSIAVILFIIGFVIWKFKGSFI